MNNYEEPFDRDRLMKIVAYVRLQTGAVASIQDMYYHEVGPALQLMYWNNFLAWARKKVGAIP